MTDRVEPLVYTVTEYAALMKCSTSTVHRQIEAGRIPAVRYGAVVRIPKWFADEELRKHAA